MTKQVQIRRGTDSQHTSFTGAEGEISVNTTNDSVHVHDGTTAGGKEMARADGSNVAFTSGTIDGTVIGGATPAAGTFTTGDFNTSLNVDGTITSDGLTVDGNATIQNTGNSYRTISLDANRTAAVNTLGRLDYKWNGNEVVRLHATSGSDTTNKDNGSFTISTSDDGTLDQRLKIDSNGDISFYEDTGTTAKLFWDASAEALGLGTTSPQGDGLHVKVPDDGTGIVLSGTTSTAGTEVRLSALNEAASAWHNLNIGSNTTIFRTAGTQAMVIDASQNVGVGTSSPAISGNAFTTLNVKGNASNIGLITVTSNDLASSVQLYSGNSSSDNPAIAYQNDLRFGSATDAGVGGFAERMRISSGNLLVGKSVTTFSTDGVVAFSPNDANGSRVNITNDGGEALNLNRKTSDGLIAGFYKDGSRIGSISTIASTMYLGTGDVNLRLGASTDIRPAYSTGLNRDNAIDLGTSAARFKNFHLNGGIYFGSRSNALSDYEEGTYSTALVASTSGSIFMTTGSSTLSYVKVGDIVHIQGYLRVDSVSSPTGRININLPFTCKSGNQYRSAVLVSFNSIASGNIADMWAIIEAGSSQIHIYMGDGTNVQSDAANAMQAGSDVRIQATYQVA